MDKQYRVDAKVSQRHFLGDKGERNGGRGEIIVQNKQTNKQKSVGAELGCDSARSTGKKKAIGLSGTKKVGGEQMTRAVFAREGKARKEPVLADRIHVLWQLRVAGITYLQIQKQSWHT